MQNRCVYFKASATLVESLHQTCSNLLRLWKSVKSLRIFSLTSRQLISFSLFRCLMAPHLEVNQLELFVQCPLKINMTFTTSIYTTALNKEVMKLPLHQELQNSALAPLPSLLTQVSLLCNLRVPQGVSPNTTPSGHLTSCKVNTSQSSLNPHPETTM